jgi:IS66 Orf2 like protein
MLFGLPDVKFVYLYPKPIPMSWGEKKLIQICKNEMGLDPVLGGAFLFYNSKLDQLKLFFLTENGCQLISKLLPKGGFMVPLKSDDEKYIRIAGNMMNKLFKSP